MKHKKDLFLIIILLLGLIPEARSQHSTGTVISGEWKCDLSFNDMMGPFTTFLTFTEIGDTAFISHSAFNADIRILGRTRAKVARFLGKSPKKGIYLHIVKGKITHVKNVDSIHGQIVIPMVGKMELKGIVENNKFYSSIFDSNEVMGTLTGTRIQLAEPIQYNHLVHAIYDTTRRYLFNPAYLHHNKWKKFEKKILKLSQRVSEDVEFFFGFNMATPKLPFSHYNLLLFPKAPTTDLADTSHYVFLEKKDDQTAYLNITSFGGSAHEMDSIFQIVFSGNYKNLVIDLRENPGGGLNSAIPFGQYLAPEKLDAGVFLTNKWFLKHPGIPDPDSLSGIPETDAKTTSDFINELKTT
ncbi:MAG: hypothetical protein KDC05_17000, partial [Bacteroidales bacterium]|nr:hypothetical protein [Bacteroidales bacterium]